MQVSSVASTKVMVRNGIGCTILPLTAVHDEVARGALAFRPISHPPLTSTCALAFRRQATNAVVAEFADIARGAMTALVDSGAWPGAQILRPDWKSAELPCDRVTNLRPAAGAGWEGRDLAVKGRPRHASRSRGWHRRTRLKKSCGAVRAK